MQIDLKGLIFQHWFHHNEYCIGNSVVSESHACTDVLHIYVTNTALTTTTTTITYSSKVVWPRCGSQILFVSERFSDCNWYPLAIQSSPPGTGLPSGTMQRLAVTNVRLVGTMQWTDIIPPDKIPHLRQSVSCVSFVFIKYDNLMGQRLQSLSEWKLPNVCATSWCVSRLCQWAPVQ